MRHIQAKDLTGSMVALVTPMNSDGSINFTQWSQLIQWHIACGTKAVVVAGTTGESALLNDAEIAELVDQAVTLCQATDTHVIVGTGHIKPEQVITANQQAHEHGASAVLVVTPYYLTLTQDALLTHFNLIADNSPLPIILYNVPNRTGIDMHATTAAKLALNDQVIGIKEAKADMERIKQLAMIKNFAVLSGDDNSFVAAMAHGADGVISVAANVRPLAIKELCDHMQLGNTAEAEQQNTKLTALYELLFHEPNPCPLKAIMHEADMISAGIRKPLMMTQLKTSDINKHLKTIRQEFNPI